MTNEINKLKTCMGSKSLTTLHHPQVRPAQVTKKKFRTYFLLKSNFPYLNNSAWETKNCLGNYTPVVRETKNQLDYKLCGVSIIMHTEDTRIIWLECV